MHCRQNWKFLTSGQQQAFCDAVIELKTNVPSVLFPGSATHRRYDDYVELHRLTMEFMPSWGHGAPAFFPWHREFLRRFESDLRAIDSDVRIPYWDWVTENGTGAPIWDATYLGTNGTAGGATVGKVMDGRFAFDAGDWPIRVKDGAEPDYLRRRFGVDATATVLPTAAQQTGTLGWPDYDLHPWDDMLRPDPDVNIVPWRNFRVFGEIVLHNLVHRWCGGTMALATSPNDPIFWLHHCNLDRLWAVWQRQHPGSDPYVPSSGAPVGHNEGDPLIFRDATDPASLDPWPAATTASAALLNHQTMADGAWYDTDPPQITLTTPSIAFANVPEGPGGAATVTHRAIVFDVVPGPCNPVTFQVTAGPTAGFGLPLSPEPVPPGHSGVPVKGRVWLSYSTADGTIPSGSVQVLARAADPLGGTVWSQTYTVNLSANHIPRPRNAVALVLDRSGSMAWDSGDGQPRVQKLREAVSTFVTMMQPGDGLGIVRFDHEVNRLLNVTDVGPTVPAPGSGRQQAQDIVAGSQLDPRGATSVGGGVAEGRQVLDDAAGAVPPYDVRAVLVLTDGNQNTPPSVEDVWDDLDARTFAIGFGPAGEVSEMVLNQLTRNHDGYLVVTGAITPGDSFRLSKYFLQIQAGIDNQQVVRDPQGELVYGAVHRIPFVLTEADTAAQVILLTPVPGLVRFELETPDGRVLDAAAAAAEPTMELVGGAQVACYRMALPVIPAAAAGTHAGTWHARLSLQRDQGAERLVAKHAFTTPALPYSLLVHAHSSLRFAAQLHQDGLEPGAVVRVAATLREYDVPVQGRARVWAELTRPDGSTGMLELQEGDGQFTAQLVTTLAGVYTLRLRAAGSTLRGRPFERETTLSAAVSAGGNRPRPVDGGSGPGGGGLSPALCRLLACIVGRRVLTPRYRWWLRMIGIELDALEDCLKRECRDQEPVRKPAGAAREPVHEHPVAGAPAQPAAAPPHHQPAPGHMAPKIATLAPVEPKTVEPARRHKHEEHFPIIPEIVRDAETVGRRLAPDQGGGGTAIGGGRHDHGHDHGHSGHHQAHGGASEGAGGDGERRDDDCDDGSAGHTH